MSKVIYLICILASLILYYQYNRIKERAWGPLWFALRLMTLLIIGLTLTWPRISLPSEERHRILAIDCSVSMIPYKDQALHLANSFMEKEAHHSKDCIAFGQTAKPFDSSQFGTGQVTDLDNFFNYLKSTYKKTPLDIEIFTDGRITESIPDLSLIPAHWTIKTIPAQGLVPVDVAIEELTLTSGLNLTYAANLSGQARFILSGENGIVFEKNILIEKGQHRITFPLTLDSEGKNLRGQIIVEGDQVAYNNLYPLEIVSSEKQSYLIITEEIDNLSKEVLSLLSMGEIDYKVIQADQLSQGILKSQTYDGFILYDCPGYAFLPNTIQGMKDAIHNLGKVCFVVGGQHSFSLGSYQDYGLEAFMPVEDRLSGPEDQGNSSLIILLDTSGSMADSVNGTQKITMAKSGVASVLKTLHPDDCFGLIGFSDTYEWLLDLDKVSNIKPLENNFSTIGAKGGTLIKPSLVKAYESLNQYSLGETRDKHLLLITDGQGDQEAYEDLIDQFQKKKISLSTIGIGEDVAENFLMSLADQTGGTYYKVARIADLPSIMVRDIYENTKASYQEGHFAVTATEGHGTDFFIEAYIATTPKEDSQVLLEIDTLDPLLIKKSYGIGQVVALTTCLDSAWTGNYLESKDNIQLLLELLKTLPLKINNSDMSLKQDENRARLYTSSDAIKKIDVIYKGELVHSQGVESKDEPFIYSLGNQVGHYQFNGYNKQGDLVNHLDLNHAYSNEFAIHTDPQWISHPKLFNQRGESKGEIQIKTKYITWPIICLLFIGSIYYRGK